MAKGFDKQGLLLLVLLVIVAAVLMLDVIIEHKMLLDTTIMLHKKDIQIERRLNALEMKK